MLPQGRYTHLVEANIFGVIVGDAEGHIYEANDAFLNMVGYSREEVIGGSVRWHHLTPPEYKEAEARALHALIEKGRNDPWEKEYLRKDGTRVPALVSGVVLDKEALLGMAFIIDLTEQKRMEEERRQLQLREQEADVRAEVATAQLALTFEAITDGVTIFDTRGNTIHTNTAGRALLGVDNRSEQTGTFLERVGTYLPRDEQGNELSQEQWPAARILAGEVFKGPHFIEMRLRTLDDREIEVSVSGAPMYDKDGHITGGIMVYRDVTEQREQTRRVQNALERQRDLANANELAQRTLNQRMDEFISIVSHELRSPITTISGLLQLAQWRLRPLLQQNAHPETTPANSSEGNTLTQTSTTLSRNLTTIQELLVRAEQQLMMQNRLVGDLLDSTRVQATHLELHCTPHNLIMLVRQVVEDLQGTAPTRCIALQLPDIEEITVVVDADRISQVLVNYLTNALKYSPQERPVTVTLAVEEETHEIRVAVIDQGPGLSSQEQERIWERFYRAPSVAPQHGAPPGLGLGLHICRALIEQHGGHVGLESKQGEGSTFWFTLPLSDGFDVVA